ncbi:hypothetical protein BC939DRAFT_456258, partial [Gamsiella multidivaricata]|uniref:uncharacterized protein n=1 Tax=Gamsiella multidivaricata TaxID=101098 RepID=UPI00221F86C7
CSATMGAWSDLGSRTGQVLFRNMGGNRLGTIWSRLSLVFIDLAIDYSITAHAPYLHIS